MMMILKDSDLGLRAVSVFELAITTAISPRPAITTIGRTYSR
jgi:hypothetical protein